MKPLPAPTDEPARALEALAGSSTPFLIGVRHHSPACSAAVGPLLDRMRPSRIYLELPVELQPWLEWLARPGLEAPVALSAVGADGAGLAFYPMADFSPELATLRWAAAHNVPVEAFDLPLARRAGVEEEAHAPSKDSETPTLLETWCKVAGSADSESLWDQEVEARAPRAEPEAIRRAALLSGWGLRIDAVNRGGMRRIDRARETFMRSRLRDAPPGSVAVVGAFHGSALLADPLLFEPLEAPAEEEGKRWVTSLIPYDFELLDSRSGYPAGIRDPHWQQRVLEKLAQGESLESLVALTAVEVARQVRSSGHVAGVPDAAEAARMSLDLARLRGLPSPGRREMLEALQSSLAQGELLGRGRLLARALQHVMVGRRRGRLAQGTPRSGLLPHVEEVLKDLRLPGLDTAAASADPIELRLDPNRSPLDRRRSVALERLAACAIPYAARGTVASIGAAESLTRAWTVKPNPATEAMIELAGIRGPTLERAAEGSLQAHEGRVKAEGGLTPAVQLELLRSAAECGLGEQVHRRIAGLLEDFQIQATLTDLISAIALLEALTRGHVPGLPVAAEDTLPDVPLFAPPSPAVRDELISAAVRSVEGLQGSTRIEDARALLELIRSFENTESTAGSGRLLAALDLLARDGSPLMQGAGGAARVVLGREPATNFSTRLGSWVDSAVDLEQRRALAARLKGTLIVAAPQLEADPQLLGGLTERVEAQSDEDFLRRAPAFREGFEVLSPAARQRLLDALLVRHPEAKGSDPRATGLDLTLELHPEELLLYARAEKEGSHRLAQLDLLVAPVPLTPGAPSVAQTAPPGPDHALPAIARWRLILGRQRQKLPPSAARYARALDELYGSGQGEGSRSDLGPRGGREEAFPSVREWGEELDQLFGEQVREEVLGRATERGRGAAATELNPDRVSPSVELLEQILSLRGGLSEAHLAKLRPLVARIVEQLVKELSNRIRPALTGLATPLPSRRRAGPLDLRRTVERNLHTARELEGRWTLSPEHFTFRTRARRSLDWRIILVVDVSGSMEPSTIYSALMAAILSALPAVTVNFLAFNTEVIDLSNRVDDPLGLLMEVQVGGGTWISKALRYARELVTVPSRTLMLVVTDFEEGFSIEDLVEEVRTVVGSGVKGLGLATLDDRGKPRYSRSIAELVASAGMPIAALTPLELARWVGEQIK